MADQPGNRRPACWKRGPGEWGGGHRTKKAHRDRGPRGGTSGRSQGRLAFLKLFGKGASRPTYDYKEKATADEG